MTYKKLAKSTEELLRENMELKTELTRVQEELEKVRKATGITELKQQQLRLKTKLRKRTLEIKDINRSLRDDIIEFKRTKDALEESGKQLSSVYNSMSDGLAVHHIIYDDKGNAVDYIIDDVNPSYEKITGLNKGEITGKKATEVYAVEKSPYIDIYSEVVSSGNPKFFETYFLPMRKHFQVSVFSPGEGKFATIFQDITERKRSEEELAFQAQLLSDVNDSVFSSDNNYVITYWNKAAEKMFGWTKEEALGKNSGELLKPKIEGSSRDQERAKLRRAGHWEGELQYIRKDGIYISVEVNSTVLKDTYGKDIGNVIVSRDITERKRAEEALKKSEALYRAIGESIDYGIWICDAEGKNIYASESYLKLVGLTQEQCSEFGWGDTLHPDDAERTIAAWKECAKTGDRWDIEHRFKGVDGKWHPILARGIPIRDDMGNISMWAGINLDISKIKETEDALRQSEERLRVTLTSIGDAVITVDISGKIAFLNPVAVSLTGWEAEEAIGQPVRKVFRIINEITQQPAEDIVKRVLDGDNFIGPSNHSALITKDGQHIPIEDSAAPIKDQKGNVTGVIVVFHDVTTKRHAEEDLQNALVKYKTLFDCLPLGVTVSDEQGKIIESNHLSGVLLGLTKKEQELRKINGQKWQLIAPDGNPMQPADYASVRALKENRLVENVEMGVIKSDNMITWLNVTAAPIPLAGFGVLIIYSDITARRFMEENLRESEIKLRSVLDATKESIYMFDRDGKLCMSNSTGIARLKKSSEDEIIGHHFSEFMAPEIAKQRTEKLDEVFTSGTAIEFEDERNSRIFHHNFFPVHKDNKVLFVVTYSTDITLRKRAESELLESENRFRTIAEALPVMISITRMHDETISFVNEPFIKSFGYSKDELIGKKSPDIFFYGYDRENIGVLLNETGVLNSREIKVKRSNGKPFWIIAFIRIINFMNEPSYFVSSIDITETKRTQEDLIRLNRTLNANSKSSQVMMHSTDEISYLNKVCKIIIEDCGHSMVWIGYAENDEQKSVRPVAYYGFDQGYIDQMKIVWNDTVNGRGPTGTAIRTGKPSMCRNMLTDPTFEPWRKAAIERGYASSIVLPLMSEGKPFGAISIYSKDQDPFSETEVNLLTELANDLAYGISFIRLTEAEREATSIIKESESKLKDLVATKDKFFNIIAHDLKNPFTSLLGASELLYENISQMSTENVRKLALILNDSAKSGYAILQNLLDWSRSETGLLKFNPELLSLKMLIDENIENLQLQITNKEINLTSVLKEDLFIFADKNMLNTILRNLMSNAVKYTYKNGTILVKASQNPEEIIVTVKDSGIGIQKEKVDTLFRIDNSISLPGTEKEQGTGLGLKLCKEFTERMGGRIWVESEIGHGSEFKFSIPVKNLSERAQDEETKRLRDLGT